MKPCFIRRASKEDALYIAKNLTPEDREEVVAATGIDPEVVLPASITPTREVYVAGLEHTGTPAILFGCDPVVGDEEAGVIWLLTTPEVYDFPVETAWHMKKFYDAYAERYPLLMNFIDERNKRHLQIIKWFGFKPIRRIEKFGPKSLPFIQFASYTPCA